MDTNERSEKEIYEIYKESGVDYNFYGIWQQAYAKFVVSLSNVLFLTQKENISLLDIGTACGVNLLGFKETKMFSTLVGIDKNKHFIDIGKEKHNFTDDELICMDAINLKNLKTKFDMIHCSQMMEHLTYGEVNTVIKGMADVLNKNGVIFITIDATNSTKTEEYILTKDPTGAHKIAKPLLWWEQQFSKYFKLDTKVMNKFRLTKHSPNHAVNPYGKDIKYKTFYDFYGDSWGIILGVKK